MRQKNTEQQCEGGDDENDDEAIFDEALSNGETNTPYPPRIVKRADRLTHDMTITGIEAQTTTIAFTMRFLFGSNITNHVTYTSTLF